MYKINPVVATVSPNLYNAAKTANLNPKEVNQVEQMSYTINEHRQLTKLGEEAARKRYDSLDVGIQDQLKFMFKEANYMQPPETVADKVQGFLGGTLKLAASPLIGLLKLGGAYNRAINTPYAVARQVYQGAELFSAKTWHDGWDGRSLYDNSALKEATDYFGKFDVEVAKGLLAGRTPGEIVEAYGSVDSNLLESIKKAYNDPDAFKEVLEGVKFTQISPGRDLARMLDDDGNPSVYTKPSSFAKGLSGKVDFMYQIAVDPLTWMTGGFSKGVTKGDRIAKTISERLIKNEKIDVVVSDAFKNNPELSNFWDNGIGPLIKRFAETEKGAKGAVFEEIGKRFPGYNDRTIIEAFAEPTAKVYDAASAEKYFTSAQNLNYLMAGRVSGLSYSRNGVVVARTSRNLYDSFSRYLDSVFNATTPQEFAGKVSKGRTVAQRDPATEPIINLISKPEVLQRKDMKVIEDATAEIRGWRLQKIGQLAARSPLAREVEVGLGAARTAENFTIRARQILPRDMAQTLTEHFLASTVSEQFVILRNLDAATMYSMGLGGHAKGEELIAKILRQKYGVGAGMGTKVDRTVPTELVNDTPKHIMATNGTNAVSSNLGNIHRYQATYAVGALPYNEIGSMVWQIKSKKFSVEAIGGAVQGDFSKKLVDVWSFLTLLPRLGIRSSIDEMTMYLLTAPTRDVFSLATLQGRKMANVSRTFTGSTLSTGPIKRGVQRLFNLAPDKSLIDNIGKKIKISPEEALDDAARYEALEVYALSKNLDISQLTSLQKREAVGASILNMYGPYIRNQEDLGYLLQAFKYSPDALDGMAQALIGNTGISGEFGEKVLQNIITPTMLDKAFASFGSKMYGKTVTVNTSKLSERQIAGVQYEKWYKLFVGNKYRIKSDSNPYFTPSQVFLKNNALRTKDDYVKAIDESMEQVGFTLSPVSNTWTIYNPALVSNFLGDTMDTVSGRAAGLSDGTIARGQLANIFLDMRETFHGSSELSVFNDDLLALMTKKRKEVSSSLQTKSGNAGKQATLSQSAAAISLDDFHDASKGFQIQGEVNTTLDFGDDIESIYRRFGNWGFEQMDKQVTGIFRQPAINIAYVAVRKKYAGAEKEMTRQLTEGWTKGSAVVKGSKEYARIVDLQKAVAEKHFTEISLREAADTVLKFADNPSIRSNFSYSARTVGRYYRATEDFYRRIYRMKDVAPRVLYRMRLAHLGLDASGGIHTDTNGMAYVVMPMDNVLFKATDATMRVLTGNDNYRQPQFNQFTLKLSMLNPSFSQDAGVPTLSGPIAGLSVIGVKNFLGMAPEQIPFIGKYLEPYGTALGESIDTFALGNIGDNINITRAIVPAGLQKIYALTGFDEKSRQEVTAAQQAIAYNAANGISLRPDATDAEKAQYLKNIRISAHNIVFLRNLLGLFAPVAPQLSESIGVPDYLKDVGITSLRAEFFELLDGISKANNGDVVDPYEQALVTFMGENPGKLIYTISRTEKTSKVVVRNSEGLKNWAIRNKSMIDTYGSAAYIFAPRTGDFNAGSYNWIQASGLMKDKTLEEYYDDLAVAEDKQRYYDIGKAEKEQLAKMSDPQLRANLINEATDARKALKAANPLLNQALIGRGNNIGSEETMLTSVEEMINDPKTSVPASTRQRMVLAVALMRDFIAFAKSPNLNNVVNKVDLKRQRKLQIEADLRELMLGDLYVTEANRAIFKSILNFYSRDSSYAFKELI